MSSTHLSNNHNNHTTNNTMTEEKRSQIKDAFKALDQEIKRAVAVYITRQKLGTNIIGIFSGQWSEDNQEKCEEFLNDLDNAISSGDFSLYGYKLAEASEEARIAAPVVPEPTPEETETGEINGSSEPAPKPVAVAIQAEPVTADVAVAHPVAVAPAPDDITSILVSRVLSQLPKQEASPSQLDEERVRQIFREEIAEFINSLQSVIK